MALSSILLNGCSSQPAGRAGNNSHSLFYFSMKGYFDHEAARMQGSRVQLVKTITLDKSAETKKMSRINWASEMEFFSSSDINKPAWLGKYHADSSAGILTYTALDSSLKVRKIEISRQTGLQPAVRRIAIHLVVQNFLYSLDEQLLYIPDSLYTIDRRQHIHLLGIKHYTIIGKISP